jgi:DGQHR domain-containing protein
METELITINDKEFLKLELFSITQKEKSFFIGKLLTKYIMNIFTVEPTEYDIQLQISNAKSFVDDKEYYNYLITEDRQKIDTKAFQRKESQSRIKEISKFINDEEYAIFPNTIIVTCELLNEHIGVDPSVPFDEKIIELYTESNPMSYLEIINNHTFLYIPYQKNSLLVIDGQHRLKGLNNSKKEITDEYELLLSFIIGYDRSAVANLFYTINYTQKSVNKSLLYHLTGEFSRELDEITFLHETVKILNEIDKSPFYKRIRMLGTVPEKLPPSERERVTVSQAFLIDYLINTISRHAINSIHPPVFLYYYKNENYRIEIIRFVIKYFRAIQNIKCYDWDSPKDSIICKTISIGAFIKVFHYIYIKLFIENYNYDAKEIVKISSDELKKFLNGIENINFSKSGEFGGVASAGTLNKLKEKIVENIKFFNATNYDNFIKEYKTKYLPDYKKWFLKNVG